MPELPEVEIVRQGLNQILRDKPTLTKIEFMRTDLRDPIPIRELKKLEGQRVQCVERRAKYLLIWMEEGGMLSHLGMTGTWRMCPPGGERLHDHIYLYFDNKIRLAFRDPRRFGCFDYVHKKNYDHPKLKRLGPEPLSQEFSSDYLLSRLRNKKMPIKVAIMNQEIVVGVGNIYACEALFAAGIKPTLASSRLSLMGAEKLVLEIKKILRSSIDKGGSSISDFTQTNGQSGYFQNTFKVYARSGEICFACGQKVKSKIVGGRNTFWCSRCQI